MIHADSMEELRNNTASLLLMLQWVYNSELSVSFDGQLVLVCTVEEVMSVTAESIGWRLTGQLLQLLRSEQSLMPPR
jgi:hypothetical protein